MRKFKKILLILTIILVLTTISLSVYFLLKKFDITSIKTLREFISNFGAWGWIVYIVLQVIISTPIFVVPFEDEMWVTLSILLFGVQKGFILSVAGMILTSSALYLLGRKLGVKIASKIVGEEELVRVQSKFDIKNKLSLPFMYLIPCFPHDVLCVVSGLSKMKFIYFFMVTLFLRSIEIFSICFLSNGFIDWKSLTAFDWLVLLNLVVIDIYLMKKLSNFMEKRLDKKIEGQKKD